MRTNTYTSRIRRSVGSGASTILVTALLLGVAVRPALADRVTDLADTLENDRSEKARIAAAVGLGRLADPRGVPALTRALSDKSAVVRGVAASALGHIGDARAIPALEKALGDETDAVRTRAREALARIREKQARDSGGGSVATGDGGKTRRKTPKMTARPVEDASTDDKGVRRRAPKEAPRPTDDEDVKLFVIVQSVSNKTSSGGKTLSGKLREFVVAELNDSPEITLDARAGKTLKQFTLDGSITQLERGESGVWVEIFCEVKITVSNEKGRMLGIVTGTATLQLAKRSFKTSMEGNLQVQALENAVHGAHQNLLGYLARQVATN